MKKSLCFVLSFVVMTPALALATPFQDLDRVNEIVKQARELADEAKSQQSQGGVGVAVGINTAVQPPLRNPFAQVASPNPRSDVRVGNPAVRGAIGNGIGPGNGQSQAVDGRTVYIEEPGNRPQIGIGSDSIRIGAGGKQFVVPRVGPTRDNVDPYMAMSSRNAPRNGNLIVPRPGQSFSANGALATANNYRVYAEATQLFRGGEYAASLAKIKQVNSSQIAAGPITQFHGLNQFAVGNYSKSAELAYSAAAGSPHYSWDQLRGFYGDREDYANQYRQLSQIAAASADPSLRFLLGYHHLMLGHRQHASREFEFVLTKLPEDPVIKKLLSIARQLPPAPLN